MHFRNTAALALLFVAACASDSAGPLVKNVGGEDGAGLAGRVLGFTRFTRQHAGLDLRCSSDAGPSR